MMTLFLYSKVIFFVIAVTWFCYKFRFAPVCTIILLFYVIHIFFEFLNNYIHVILNADKSSSSSFSVS